MHRKPKILVVGSFVMDVIAATEKIPGSGQTVYGKSFHMAPGGKGANQALQCARLGAEVTMVGSVGDDLFGQQLLEPLRAAGMDTSHVVVHPGIHSGVGHVTLEVTEHTAQNRIVVIPGANRTLMVEEVSFCSTPCILPPASFSRPAPMIDMPYKNNAMPPSREVMCVISIAILLNTIFLFLPITAHSRRALPRLWRDPYPGSRFSFVMQRPHASTRTAPFQRSHCVYYTINPPATTRFILQENHFFHTFCWFSIVSSRFLFKHFTQILH